MLAILILLETLMVVAAQLLLRHGASRLEGESLSLAIMLEPLRNLPIFTGLVLHGLSFFLYIFILSRLRLNVIYPVATGATIVLITICSAIFLRETISSLQALGIFTIVIGIALVFVPR